MEGGLIHLLPAHMRVLVPNKAKDAIISMEGGLGWPQSNVQTQILCFLPDCTVTGQASMLDGHCQLRKKTVKAAQAAQGLDWPQGDTLCQSLLRAPEPEALPLEQL